MGSADQLHQCIKGKLQSERDDPNVIIIVRDIQTTEQILALTNSEGEFAQTAFPRSGAGMPPARDVNKIHELQEACAQL